MMHAVRAHCHPRGFTMVEMAVTIAIIGIMAATGAAAYARLAGRTQDSISIQANTASLSEAVIAFAASRHRLPCPSMDGSGNEGTGGVCTAAQTGMFPYLAVGLPLPGPNARAWYGVYRAGTADLASAQEHTGDVTGSPDFAGRGDFLHALRIAAAQARSTSHPYLTGDGAASGPENCAAALGNPAFVIALPGTDRDGNGNSFDGIHAGLAGGGLCFAAPARATDNGFDDTTYALGFYALMARLTH